MRSTRSEANQITTKEMQNEIRVKELMDIKNCEGAKNEDETAFQVAVKGSRRTEFRESIGERASENKS